MAWSVVMVSDGVYCAGMHGYWSLSGGRGHRYAYSSVVMSYSLIDGQYRYNKTPALASMVWGTQNRFKQSWAE